MVLSDFSLDLDFNLILNILKRLSHLLADIQRFETKIWKEDSLIYVPLCFVEALH